MTRKDYVAIARAFSWSQPPRDNTPRHAQWCHDITRVCDALADDNPRFDRARFQTACLGVTA